VADATNRESLLGLKRNRAFTKAVSNMAIMDITDTHTMDMAIITTIIAQEITIMSPIVHMVEITMAEAEEELS